MPHIHVGPDQHDITVSAWIVLRENDEWKCLVHFHRKMEKLMQIGGHIELNETPWQSIAHELVEESGYNLSELEVLLHTADRPVARDYITHPVPFMMNTHNVGNEHFHSDLSYGFIARDKPANRVAAGESADLRWLTISEIEALAESGEALSDVAHLYRVLLDHVDSYARVPADSYSLEKPLHPAATYKRGAPGS
jgi:8-oxo-dGTP pyrophosphatase MutT (NUDIX family)